MDQKTIKLKLAEGYIQIRAIVEVAGSPENYVVESLQKYMDKIEKDEAHVLIEKEVHEAKEQKDGIFSAFAEIEMLVKDGMTMLSFCFDYMPSSIEIVAPTRLQFDNIGLGDFLNDMQARLHAVNMGISNYQAKNNNLIKNTTTLMKNFIVFIIKQPKTLDQIQEITGIKQEQIKNLLSALEKENVIQLKGDMYSKK